MVASIKKQLSQSMSDPYPLFFFFGAIFSMLGALVWLGFFSGLSHVYPNVSHPQLMIGGFILMFVSGFLLTAVPRFTETKSASVAEITSVFAPILISQLFINHLYFNLVQYIAVFNLSVFAVKRVVSRKNNPPPPFVFIGSALVCLHLGLLIKIANSSGAGFAEFSFLAQKLYTEAATLFLIFGVGSKVIPMIKGFEGKKPKNSWYILFALASLVLLVTYLVEYNSQIFIVTIIRNSIFTAMALLFWKTHLFPPRKSKLNTCLRIAELMILAGLWAPLFLPEYYVHFKHLMFIGGFGLITFLISTRVIFAHGAAGIEHEKSSPYYWPILIVCLFAIAFRVSIAFVSEQHRGNILILSASLWMLLCLVWLYGFFGKALKTK
jgi:uncharacterized protein involved in response to NO